MTSFLITSIFNGQTIFSLFIDEEDEEKLQKVQELVLSSIEESKSETIEEGESLAIR